MESHLKGLYNKNAFEELLIKKGLLTESFSESGEGVRLPRERG